MSFTPSNIAALVIAASFAAGLNVYATILTLGILARLHWAVLPGGLEMLGDWWVLIASGALFAAEFVADKIPGLDLVWNALHTFVRIPLAALLAYGATTHLSPPMQFLAIAIGSGIAMAAHTSKTAIRTAVTPSPEPFSNIALSASEDVGAVGLSWLVTVHPWASASVALVAVVLAIFAVRWVVRAMRGLWTRTRGALAQRPQIRSAG
jgi:Domain of unknown function (DUF4126)